MEVEEMVVWTSNDRSCLPCLLGSKKVQMKASVKDLGKSTFLGLGVL